MANRFTANHGILPDRTGFIKEDIKFSDLQRDTDK